MCRMRNVQTVCPIQNKFEPVKFEQKAYALKHTNEKERKTSSSGGAFIEIAKLTVNNGGSVYGAAFDENFKVKHIRATTMQELERLKTSKYLQSNVNSVFKSVKQDLEAGKAVLFSGTSCQVEGLRKYLKSRIQIYCA